MNTLARIIAYVLLPFRWLMTLRRTVGAPVLLTKSGAGYRMALAGHIYVKHGASPWFDERALAEAPKSVARVLTTAASAIGVSEAVDRADEPQSIVERTMEASTKQAELRAYDKPEPRPEHFGFELIQFGGDSQTTVVRMGGRMWHSVGCIKWFDENGVQDGSGPNSLWKRWKRYEQATKSFNTLSKVRAMS